MIENVFTARPAIAGTQDPSTIYRSYGAGAKGIFCWCGPDPERKMQDLDRTKPWRVIAESKKDNKKRFHGLYGIVNSGMREPERWVGRI